MKTVEIKPTFCSGFSSVNSWTTFYKGFSAVQSQPGFWNRFSPVKVPPTSKSGFSSVNSWIHKPKTGIPRIQAYFSPRLTLAFC
jgi:hypothetical protein